MRVNASNYQVEIVAARRHMPALGVRFDGLMLAEDGSLHHLIWSLDIQQSRFDFHKNGGRLIFVFLEREGMSRLESGSSTKRRQNHFSRWMKQR